MKKNNSDNSWLIYFIAVILILAGVFVEPLAAVLGILIVVASLISKLVEGNAHHKLVKKAEEEALKAQQQVSQEKTV
ncbi:MAG: hypothetical protein IJZ82_05265 [Lachnospiraceae bacterium]|nr:hypothetical protein [Lachnospiraceae bacterium]